MTHFDSTDFVTSSRLAQVLWKSNGYADREEGEEYIRVFETNKIIIVNHNVLIESAYLISIEVLLFDLSYVSLNTTGCPLPGRYLLTRMSCDFRLPPRSS
jgi:hypothetical protein